MEDIASNMENDPFMLFSLTLHISNLHVRAIFFPFISNSKIPFSIYFEVQDLPHYLFMLNISTWKKFWNLFHAFVFLIFTNTHVYYNNSRYVKGKKKIKWLYIVLCIGWWTIRNMQASLDVAKCQFPITKSNICCL